MRRKTRRLVANLVFFSTALFLIVYLNQPQTSSKTFFWTTIRYRTTSTSLPSAHGICPGLASASKPALIVSRVSADGPPTWLDPLRPLYHTCIFTADASPDPPSTTLQVTQNRGHEAMAYLTFIIDNYDHLPAAGMVFIHGSRWAWHNDAPDYDNDKLLSQLNVSDALEWVGYHNLKCDWGGSMCEEGYAPSQGSWENKLSSVLEPWDLRAVSDAMFSGALGALFGAEGKGRVKLGRGDKIRAQCCAQFVVGRDRVWAHEREEYVQLRQWLLDGSRGETKEGSEDVAPSDDRVAGRILSYMWHILFLPQEPLVGTDGAIDLERLNAMACPSAEDCYCRLYGRCGLDGCNSPGRCEGQYRLPLDYRLPDDWAATHS